MAHDVMTSAVYDPTGSIHMQRSIFGELMGADRNVHRIWRRFFCCRFAPCSRFRCT